MKKVLSLMLIVVFLLSGLFVLTGCGDNGNSNDKKADNTTEISYVNGKGKFTLKVPKKDDGTPKYEFTTTKPETAAKGTFYLETDTATFAFATSGLVYNTSKVFKEKNGEQKATFDGFLEWMKDPDSTIKLSGLENFEINGRKAIRYYNRTGGSGSYVYDGYFYAIAGDDLYPGSRIEMAVKYKTTEKLTEAKEFDEETLAIINSLKVEAAETK